MSRTTGEKNNKRIDVKKLSRFESKEECYNELDTIHDTYINDHRDAAEKHQMTFIHRMMQTQYNTSGGQRALNDPHTITTMGIQISGSGHKLPMHNQDAQKRTKTLH